MIITSENVRIGEIPEECPLRKEEVTVIYKINL
jgi:hypothetical protein